MSRFTLYNSQWCIVVVDLPPPHAPRQLLPLIKIIVPGMFSPEVGVRPHTLAPPSAHTHTHTQSGFLVLVAVMLVLRTVADVWMIQNGTSIEA